MTFTGSGGSALPFLLLILIIPYIFLKNKTFRTAK